MRRLVPAIALILAAACDRAAAREPRHDRAAGPRTDSLAARADSSTLVARQAGEPVSTMSTVMQLRLDARDGQVTIEDGAGRQALAGAPGGARLEDIPGSRATALSDDPADSLHAGWRAMASIPVLEGERYLAELLPAAADADYATLELSADGHTLARARVPAGAAGEPALFEVMVGARSVVVGPRIEAVEVVPACGTAHVVRSFGRADLHARYEVVGTGESGDLHLPPRADDARFRGVTFQTRTRGDVVISYLGRELARAAMPEGCGGE